MNISKMASTVILATAFATILLFAFLFYLYGDFKNALSVTASFFGGIATLVAAYVATQLFNDWKEQHNKTILAYDAKNLYRKLSGDIMVLAEIRTIIKRELGNTNIDSLKKALESLGSLPDIQRERTVDLKNFSSLAQDKNIDPLLRPYIDELRELVDYANDFAKKHHTLNNVFVEKVGSHIEEIARKTLKFNQELHKYILLE